MVSIIFPGDGVLVTLNFLVEGEAVKHALTQVVSEPPMIRLQ
jgi:hypothetical protein